MRTTPLLDPFDAPVLDEALCDGEGNPLGSYHDAPLSGLLAIWDAHRHNGVPAPIDLIDALAGHGFIAR